MEPHQTFTSWIQILQCISAVLVCTKHVFFFFFFVLLQIPELQEELDTTLLKLETAQSHANELAVSTKEAKMLKEDLIKIKLQLQEEKVQR